MLIKIWKLVKEILFLIIGFFVCVGLALLFNPLSQIFLGIFLLISITWFTIKLLLLGSWINHILDLQKLKKDQGNKSLLLYQWLSKGDVDNKYFYEVFKGKEKNDLLANLREVKKILKIKIGHELSDYYLLKNYLEVHEKNNILDKFSTILLSAAIGFCTAVLTKLGTTEYAINKVSNFIFGTGTYVSTETVSTILDICTYVLISLALIIYTMTEFTKEKRRIEMIKGIVDSIIIEKESEN